MATFDPSRVLVGYHGVNLSGFADGTFIDAERDTDSFGKTVGADGEVVWSKSADDSGKIELTLLQGTPSNDFLSAELATDELTGANVASVFVKDLRGTTLVQGAECRLAKPAPVSFGKDIVGVKWTILVAHMRVNVGKNV